MFVAGTPSTYFLIDLGEQLGFAIWNNKVVICQSGQGEGLEKWMVQIKAPIGLSPLPFPASLSHIPVQLNLQVKLKSCVLFNSWLASQHAFSRCFCILQKHASGFCPAGAVISHLEKLSTLCFEHRQSTDPSGEHYEPESSKFSITIKINCSLNILTLS